VDGDGRLTGRYDGANCRGAQKLHRVRQWMATWPGTAHVGEGTPPTTGATAITPFLWAYGNSDGDRQLLGGADIGVDVGRLGRFGALRGFPRLGDVTAGAAPA
jgi:hypothetical protein